MRGPILASVPAGLGAYLFARAATPGLFSLVEALAIGGLVYGAILCLLEFRLVRQDLGGLAAMLDRRREGAPA